MTQVLLGKGSIKLTPDMVKKMSSTNQEEEKALKFMKSGRKKRDIIHLTFTMIKRLIMAVMIHIEIWMLIRMLRIMGREQGRSQRRKRKFEK